MHFSQVMKRYLLVDHNKATLIQRGGRISWFAVDETKIAQRKHTTI